MSHKRVRSPSPPASTQIYRSSPIDDRASTFIAVFSPTLTAEQLQARLELKDASHRIAAWRHPSNQRSLDSQPLFETGHDDDGENHGGKTLEKVLTTKKVAGAVVVARWYGGVMLGPVRFDHIRNCAGNAIFQWTLDSERSAKRVKLQTEKERLVGILPERDRSIAVLRDLLAEKKGGAPPSQEAVKGPPTRPMDYATMGLDVLERLEKVRDRTIEWVLEQIEKAEKVLEEASRLIEEAPGEALGKSLRENNPLVDAQKAAGDTWQHQEHSSVTGRENGSAKSSPSALSTDAQLG